MHHGDTEFTEKKTKHVFSVFSVSPWFLTSLSSYKGMTVCQ